MKSLIFTFAVLISTVAPAQILITEIMYNPPESGQDSLEFIELYNNSVLPINLQGWSFPEGIVHVFDDVVLLPDQYLIVCVNEQAYINVIMPVPGSQVIQWTSGALNNGGEPVSLANNLGQTVFRVVYSNGGGGWYSSADGNGASLELCNFEGDPNDSRKWRASENPTGLFINNIEIFATPGEENSVVCGLEPDAEVTVGDFFFNPADITIEVGQVVRWTNTGGFHNVNGTQAVFPSNPESFFNGPPSTANWEYIYQFNTAGFYQYQCDPHSGMMMGSITVTMPPDPYPLYTIGEVRSVDQDGVADSIGVSCSLIGTIYGVNQRDIGLLFTLIDEAGDGIGLFSGADIPGITLQEGDEVRVWGELSQFRGLLQMNVVGVEVLGTNNELIDPIIVVNLDEFSESRLVQLRNMSIVDPSEWTNDPNGFNVRIVDQNSNEFLMRIARNVDAGAEAPEIPFHLTGIGGQFSESATPPLLDGYQILPRYAEDILVLVSVIDNTLDIKIDIYPNPAVNYLYLNSEIELKSVGIRNSMGQFVSQFHFESNQIEIPVYQLPVGVYFMEIETSKGLVTRRFSKL